MRNQPGLAQGFLDRLVSNYRFGSTLGGSLLPSFLRLRHIFPALMDELPEYLSAGGMYGKFAILPTGRESIS
jgi:hypothetical protein